MLAAMKILNFKESETKGTFKVLAGLLHYSNVVLQGAVVNNLECCSVKKSNDLNNAAALLGMTSDDLVNQLTYRTIQTRGEVIQSPLHIQNAKDVQDAFIKGVYGRLFSWIVDKINSTISKVRSF
jgi:myosin-7